MTILFAGPRDPDTSGFFFHSFDEYVTREKQVADATAGRVGSLRIHYVRGCDAELFNACRIDQTTLKLWFETIEHMASHEKETLYYLTECHGRGLRVALEQLGLARTAFWRGKSFAAHGGWLQLMPEYFLAYFGVEPLPDF